MKPIVGADVQHRIPRMDEAPDGLRDDEVIYAQPIDDLRDFVELSNLDRDTPHGSGRTYPPRPFGARVFPRSRRTSRPGWSKYSGFKAPSVQITVVPRRCR